jgi:Pectate lyase superfamily protein
MVRAFLLAAAAVFLSTEVAAIGQQTLAFGDGITDATQPIQQLLDAASAHGGEVFLPPGQYLLKGTITVPRGVTLRGSWDAPHHGSVWDKGSTLLVTGGRGQEEGPGAIELRANAAVEGITMLWPEQTPANLTPYPWAIHGNGMHDTVENVTLVNAYQGVKMGGPGDGSLHLIRNVFGCVLRRGIMIDGTTDIGRIENVHFNPHYWGGSRHPSRGNNPEDWSKLQQFMNDNLEAFIFARSDWEYVVDTFVWGAKSGYLFIETKSGACNGQFLGIGADYCQACVRIEKIQPIGLQITNGEFTAFSGDPNSAVVTEPGAGGAAQFVNCNFWGVKNHVAWLQGSTAVTLSDCHICDKLMAGAVLAEKGRLIVRGCVFDQSCPAVILKPDVSAAIVAENLQPGGLQIENDIGSRAVIGLNQAQAPAPGN